MLVFMQSRASFSDGKAVGIGRALEKVRKTFQIRCFGPNKENIETWL